MSYEYLAEQYDGLMYDAPSEEWFSYITKLTGPPCRVLEYACGTGRITEQLVRSGYETIAVDRSEAMLNRALTRLRPLGGHVDLIQADMRVFRLNHPVQLALCICDGVNYIHTDAELQEFFCNVAANLQKSGRFVFDISSAYKLSRVLGNEFFYDDNDDSTLFWSNQYNPRTKLSEMDITLFQRRGQYYERFDEVHVQRAWEEAEITEALALAGFQDIRVYEFGTFQPPHDKSTRIQFVALQSK